ncbi:MAG: hypothetical protein V3V41_03950 [Candidatus Heimdallarchaeota archaeon]
MSSDDAVQIIIKEANEILAKQTLDDFFTYIENITINLEKEDKMLESAIIWHFFEETVERLGDAEFLAYALSKLISRYILMEELDKAKEIYEKSINENLDSFHLSTVRTIYERRSDTPTKREIIEISKKDVFGDFVPIPGAPNVYFETSAQARNYLLNQLPEGTFLMKVLNHKLNNIEEMDISTETLEEFEVISVQEIVRIE